MSASLRRDNGLAGQRIAEQRPRVRLSGAPGFEAEQLAARAPRQEGLLDGAIVVYWFSLIWKNRLLELAVKLVFNSAAFVVTRELHFSSFFFQVGAVRRENMAPRLHPLFRELTRICGVNIRKTGSRVRQNAGNPHSGECGYPTSKL